ncbi:hypothetical protein EBT25_10795, partial [bacterium]|nr:hypothetical protein [bacterium]
SVVGNYSVALYNSAENRINPQQFSVSVANTWERKTITYTGDTTGTWLTTNGIGANVTFYPALGSNFVGAAGWNTGGTFGVTGQSNAIASNGNIFAITGVQLEKGSTATSFDYRPYGTELALCQRYYQKSYNIDTVPGTSTRTGNVQLGSYSNTATGMNNGVGFRFPVVMRASPTMTGYDPDVANTTGQGRWDAAGVAATQGALTFGVIGDAGVSAVTIATTGRTAGAGLTILFHYTAAIEL